jgi:solute carrier family 35 protein E3
VTTFYQVWIKEKQEEFKLNSMQLLFYQAPLSAIILLFMVPIFEQTYGLEGKIVYFELSYSQWVK